MNQSWNPGRPVDASIRSASSGPCPTPTSDSRKPPPTKPSTAQLSVGRCQESPAHDSWDTRWFLASLAQVLRGESCQRLESPPKYAGQFERPKVIRDTALEAGWRYSRSS